MHESINTFDFIFKVILYTLFLIFCFAGLYGIVRASVTDYKTNRKILKIKAFEWDLKMTRMFSFATLLMITPCLIFQQQSLRFLDEYAEAVDLGIRCAITTMVIGFIAALVTLFND